MYIPKKNLRLKGFPTAANTQYVQQVQCISNILNLNLDTAEADIICIAGVDFNFYQTIMKNHNM